MNDQIKHADQQQACSEFTLHDFTGRQPDQVVTGKEQAELRAMTLMLYYPDSRFTIIPPIP